jgi:hypothetical protein
MDTKGYPAEFVRRLAAVRGKRARVVVEHILEHGRITTEELQRDYGYEHPPRAVRDVREQGIPIETFYVESSEGRRIAAYRFGDPSGVRRYRLSGRRLLPKTLKRALIADTGSRCAICLTDYEGRYLQTDHRVPFEVAGNDAAREPHPAEFMLLCRSCNRAKSWSCEHCPNWSEGRIPRICRTCYWADPDGYAHIALRQIRRVDVVWTESEVKAFERLRRRAQSAETPLPEYVKAALRNHVRRRPRNR